MTDSPIPHPKASLHLRALLCAGLLAALLCPAQAQSVPTGAKSWQAIQQEDASKHVKFNVVFEKIDPQGYLILKYGSVSLKTRLAGIKLNGKSAGVLGLYLPTGALLQAEVVEKGTVQGVILWKNKQNLNEQLMIDGVAEGLR